jgi:hypothetical protein
MSDYLKPLSYIKSPELIEFDRDSLVEEIIARIQSDPNWNSIWDGELFHNFSYAIINIFSFLFSKNAETANRILREGFITEAKDPASIINYLANFSMNLKQNEAAMVEINISPTDGGSFTNEFTLPAGYSLIGNNINGQQVNYEIYNFEYDDNGNITTKLDYRSPIIIPPSNFYKVNAFSGITKQKDITLNPAFQQEKFIYNITDINIIDNSIRVYYEYNTINEIELIQTDSFVITPVIKGPFTTAMGGVPHYIIKYNTDGSAKIIFGSREFGGSFPNEPSNLTIIYRTGGGLLSNVARRGINQTITLAIDDFTNINVSFYNLLAGGGGADKEDINLSQFYAPYRINRNRSIVDDIDVLNTLSYSTVKHLVKSPKYNGVNVPVLHYHNYIAPIRSFDNFIFPVPRPDDTYLTYKEIFELQLNNYLNLDGIHDGSENDILINFFTTSDFSFALPYKPPLNGSLYISAYDSRGKEVDRLIWGNNYSGTFNLPDLASVNAAIISQGEIETLSINLGSNFLYFMIDSSINSGLGNYPEGEGTCFRVEISANLYTIDSNNKATALAEEIDNKIRSVSTYYSSFSESTPFAYINDDKKLVIRSLITGINSDVHILNLSNDSILNTLQIYPEKIDASPQNRKVFLENSYYDFEKHEVYVKINKDGFELTKEYFNLVPVWNDPNSKTGSIILFSLLDENNLPVLVQQGTSLTIEAINSNVTIDTLTFSGVSSTTLNYGNSDNGNVFDDLNNVCNYDYINGRILVKLTDSNSESNTYNFPKDEDGITDLYNTSTKFKITYQNKTYNIITVTETPNPYFPESEALQFLLKLKSTDKKMIGIEPLLKKVVFKPFLLDISVTPTLGYSREQAIQDVKNLIYNNFTYSSMINDISIGTGFKIQILKSFLNNKIRLPSVDTITINLPSEDLTDVDQKYYYFIFSEFFINKIKNFESTYIQLTGLSDSYRLRVRIG